MFGARIVDSIADPDEHPMIKEGAAARRLHTAFQSAPTPYFEMSMAVSSETADVWVVHSVESQNPGQV